MYSGRCLRRWREDNFSDHYDGRWKRNLYSMFGAWQIYGDSSEGSHDYANSGKSVKVCLESNNERLFVKKECPQCDGRGTQYENERKVKKNVSFYLPAGVKDGDRQTLHDVTKFGF